MAENMSDEPHGPFVELGALHQLLDKLKPDDSECTNAWYSSSEPCCKEIVLRFKNLLNKWAADETKLQNCLAADPTLTKCKHCGVIKCAEFDQLQNTITHKKCDRMTIAEREDNPKSNFLAAKPGRYTRKQEIMRNSCPIAPRLTMRNNNRNPISKIPLIDVSKTNKNRTIVQHEKNGTSVIVDKFFDGDCYKLDDVKVNKGLLIETERPLTRDHFPTKDNDGIHRPHDKSTPQMAQSCFRKLANGTKHSFALHGSRDTDIHCPGFVLCDRRRIEEGETENSFRNLLESEATNKINRSNDLINIPCNGSDTSAFSSSSAENLIRQWIKPGWNVRPVKVEEKGSNGMSDLTPGIRAAATQVIKNVQTIEAQTVPNYTNDGHDDEGKEEFFEPSIDLKIIKSPRHSNTVDCPEIKDMEFSNDDELLGTSRMMANTMWDEEKISESLESTAENFRRATKNSLLSVAAISSNNFYCDDLRFETSERFEREILYDQISSRDTVCKNAITTAASKVPLIYRKILESNEEMDWKSFEQLVSTLHPNHGEFWRDICELVSNEAKRALQETGATTEVCIELDSLPSKKKKGNSRCSSDEISFELDMTLKDIHIVVENNYCGVSEQSNKICDPE